MKEEIPLPSPRLEGEVSLEAAVAARRSVRSYTPTDLTLEEISQLLWAAQGITGNHAHKRAAPSAGARCPLEFYVCRADGVWHYDPEGHRLIRYLDEDVRSPLSQASWKQRLIAEAPVVFVIGAVFERTTSRYGDRGRDRYVPMDIGHAAQNLSLQAVALGLASVPVGAFDDGAVAEVLPLPAGQEILYMLPVGHPAR